MNNQNNEKKPLPTDVKVVSSAPPQSASTSKQPIRQSVANGSIGLLFALSGLCMPFADEYDYDFVSAIVISLIIWELLSNGLLRVNQTFTSHKPLIPVLSLVAGGLGLQFGDELFGPVVTLLGALMALTAPALAKKADAKLPAPPAEPEVDNQFSKSLLAYLLVLGGLPLAWADGREGGTYILGLICFLFSLIGAWASWAGMWKMWSMPAVTSGKLGLILFIAPLEAVIFGLFGLLRVVTGTGGPIETNWPGSMAPLIVLFGGCLATFELFKGAKKGIEDNKKKKQAEIDARKAARKAKKEAAAKAE